MRDERHPSALQVLTTSVTSDLCVHSRLKHSDVSRSYVIVFFSGQLGEATGPIEEENSATDAACHCSTGVWVEKNGCNKQPLCIYDREEPRDGV